MIDPTPSTYTRAGAPSDWRPDPDCPHCGGEGVVSVPAPYHDVHTGLEYDEREEPCDCHVAARDD